MCNWQDPGDNENFVNSLMMFDHPVQGTYKDCAFLAALSSYLWLMKPRVPGLVNVGGLSVRTFTFYDRDLNNNPITTKVQVTDKLCLPYQATSLDDPPEYWPGVWEKAYAVFKGTVAGQNPSPDTPDLSVLDDVGNPVTALERLLYGQGMILLTTQFANANEILNKLKNNVTGYIAKCPMVAWTYETATDAPDVIVYDDDQIVANHSYSILGLHYVTNLAGDIDSFVVLRNPYANTASEPSSDTVTGDWPVKNSLNQINGIALGEQDGIFALEIDAFRRYFKGFGGVGFH